MKKSNNIIYHRCVGFSKVLFHKKNVRLIVPLMFVDKSSQAQFIVHIMLVVWTVFQVSVFLKPYSSPPGNHIDCNNIDNDNNNIDTFTSKVK